MARTEDFALKALPDGKGFVLCDAQTGEIVPGQANTDTVTLRFFDLHLFRG